MRAGACAAGTATAGQSESFCWHRREAAFRVAQDRQFKHAPLGRAKRGASVAQTVRGGVLASSDAIEGATCPCVQIGRRVRASPVLSCSGPLRRRIEATGAGRPEPRAPCSPGDHATAGLICFVANDRLRS